MRKKWLLVIKICNLLCQAIWAQICSLEESRIFYPWYHLIIDLKPEIPEEKSVDIPVPLMNSLTNWFDFRSA